MMILSNVPRSGHDFQAITTRLFTQNIDGTVVERNPSCPRDLNKTTDRIWWYEYYYFTDDIFQYNSLYENIYIQVTTYRCLSPMVRLTMAQHWLAPIRWQVVIWARDGIVYWRICASLGVCEFRLTQFYYLSQRFWFLWHSRDQRKVV